MTKNQPERIWGQVIHPTTGEPAPAGMMWVRNYLSGNWFLEHIGTPYTCSPASETYWST